MAEGKAKRAQAGGHTADNGGSWRFATYAIGAILAVFGTIVLAVVLLRPDATPSGAAADPDAPAQQTAFAFFEDYHATLIVSPGTAGENTVNLNLSTHDGSGPPEDVSAVTLTAALPSAGIEPTAYPAEPVAGSPGNYRLVVSLPEAGEWEFTVSLAGEGTEPAAESTVVPIGER